MARAKSKTKKEPLKRLTTHRIVTLLEWCTNVDDLPADPEKAYAKLDTNRRIQLFDQLGIEFKRKQCPTCDGHGEIYAPVRWEKVKKAIVEALKYRVEPGAGRLDG